MKYKILNILILILIILVGYYFIRSVYSYSNQKERQNLLVLTLTAAAAIEAKSVLSLEGNQSDISKPEYQSIREKLKMIKKANKAARFVYLMTLKNGKVVFLADAEPEGSEDFSAPGSVYQKASWQLVDIFSTGRAFVEGPVKDRWGAWVSGHAPVKDLQTNRIVAIIGIDIDANDWQKSISAYWHVSVFVWVLIISIWLNSLLSPYKQGPRFFNKTALSSISFIATSMIIYFIAFTLMAKTIVVGTPMVAIIPVVTISWLFGRRSGVIAGIISFPVNLLMLAACGSGIDQLLGGGGFAGTLMIILAAAFVGSMSELTCRLNLELQERKKTEQDLIKAKDEAVQSKSIADKTNQKLTLLKKELEFKVFQRKQTEGQQTVLLDELERANKELEAFAHVVSHDLKAPLRGIRSIVGWIAEDYAQKLDQRGKEYLENLEIQTRRMNTFIEDLLQYAAIGKTRKPAEDIDIKDLIQEEIKNISPPENIKVRVSGNWPILHFERYPLQQLFQNLISNAVFHMGKPEGEVSISCKESADFWEFCVRDSGVGIDEKHLSRVFDMFYSIHPKDDKQSTGIGLAIVKKAAQNFGGKVRVESKAGVGSAFFFTLPKTASSKRGDTGYSVLIIDDNPDFINLTVRLLERSGHQAQSAKNAHEVHEIMANNKDAVDLVLLDINMPGENIMNIYRDLRELKPEMKIFICTAEEESAVIDDLFTAGVNGIIHKPLDLTKLNKLIQHDSLISRTKETRHD